MYVLCRSINPKSMFIIGSEPIKLQSSSINKMLRLLGNANSIRGKIQTISTSAKFVRIVVFQREFRLQRRFEITVYTQVVAIKFPYFCKSVFVVIITLSLLSATVNTRTKTSIVRNQNCIYTRINISFSTSY